MPVGVTHPDPFTKSGEDWLPEQSLSSVRKEDSGDPTLSRGDQGCSLPSIASRIPVELFLTKTKQTETKTKTKTHRYRQRLGGYQRGRGGEREKWVKGSNIW